MLKKNFKEALSFPTAGSLKRQLVSQKRGRAGNDEAARVNSHSTLLVSVFLLEYLLSYTSPGSEQLSQVLTTNGQLLGGVHPSRPTNAEGYRQGI